MPQQEFARRLKLRLKVNGKETAAEIEPRVSLLDLLRERLALTGTKKGCNEGACGACTVLLDGRRVNACMTLAVACEGAEITTVEGLAQEGKAVACIREGHAADAATAREWMSGNLCRCAGYPQITAAVLAAAKEVR